MPQRTFDTFIFDLDGTLLDTVPDLVLLTNWVLEQVGCPTRTPEEILSFVGGGVRRLIYLALPDDASPELQERAMVLWAARFRVYDRRTEGALPRHTGAAGPAVGARLRRGCGVEQAAGGR